MAIRVIDGLPCATFFSSGRFGFGILALVMQISIIFWPQASAWARRYREDDGVEKMLAQFADEHRVKADPYARPVKRFREAA